MKDPQKVLRDNYMKGKPPAGPVHNPVKEGFRIGFSYLKLFWAIIVLGVIFWFLYNYGEELGLVDWGFK